MKRWKKLRRHQQAFKRLSIISDLQQTEGRVKQTNTFMTRTITISSGNIKQHFSIRIKGNIRTLIN